MGQRQQTLDRLLGGSTARLPIPTTAELQASPYYDEVLRLYRLLGGVLAEPRITLRHWDMVVDGVAVELDEELHFNRERARTLDASWYDALPAFPREAYRRYCVDGEAACLQAGGFGGKWTNPSAERQFGPAGIPRDLAGPGSPRWRQRAFYDAVKDLSPLTIGVTVARIAIWDEVVLDGVTRTVHQVLASPSEAVRLALLELVRKRSARR
jgi:hypothetical protein